MFSEYYPDFFIMTTSMSSYMGTNPKHNVFYKNYTQWTPSLKPWYTNGDGISLFSCATTSCEDQDLRNRWIVEKVPEGPVVRTYYTNLAAFSGDIWWQYLTGQGSKPGEPGETWMSDDTMQFRPG